LRRQRRRSSQGIRPARDLRRCSNQDNSINDPSHPAASGSTIQIYATGEGQTMPPSVTGSISHQDRKEPVFPVSVTIGGVDAPVTYAGSAPEAVAGLLQVNVVVPRSAPIGTAISLILKIGNAASQTGTTIAITPSP